MMTILKDRSVGETKYEPPRGTEIVMVREPDPNDPLSEKERALKVRLFVHGDGCLVAPRTELMRVAVDLSLSTEEALEVLRARTACISCCAP